MNIFILEDEIDKYPRNQLKTTLVAHDLTIAKSCDEAVDLYAMNAPYDLLLLDHDMEGNYEYRPDYPNTGYQFVKWLVGVVGPDDKRPQVIIHSFNTVGARNMRLLLEDHGFDVTECPFGLAYIRQLKEQLG